MSEIIIGNMTLVKLLIVAGSALIFVAVCMVLDAIYEEKEINRHREEGSKAAFRRSQWYD